MSGFCRIISMSSYRSESRADSLALPTDAPDHRTMPKVIYLLKMSAARENTNSNSVLTVSAPKFYNSNTGRSSKNPAFYNPNLKRILADLASTKPSSRPPPPSKSQSNPPEPPPLVSATAHFLPHPLPPLCRLSDCNSTSHSPTHIAAH